MFTRDCEYDGKTVKHGQQIYENVCGKLACKDEKLAWTFWPNADYLTACYVPPPLSHAFSKSGHHVNDLEVPFHLPHYHNYHDTWLDTHLAVAPALHHHDHHDHHHHDEDHEEPVDHWADFGINYEGHHTIGLPHEGGLHFQNEEQSMENHIHVHPINLQINHEYDRGDHGYYHHEGHVVEEHPGEGGHFMGWGGYHGAPGKAGVDGAGGYGNWL